MNNKDRLANIIRWIARILGALILIFVLFFLITDVFGSQKSFGEGMISIKDYIALFCFPISTIIGLAIAFKWEGLGGLISTVGLLCLLFVRPDLSSSLLMMSLVIPGLLYIIHWIMTRKPN